MSPNWYSLLRPLFFSIDPEQAHDLALKSLQLCKPLFAAQPLPKVHASLMGMALRNPVGLGAGLDKNGAYADALGSLGFGFVEVGTITPKPQAGNPKPRLFRLVDDRAIINRMGFNNRGVNAMIDLLSQRKNFDYKLGINIGKNKDTPNDKAVNDYLICLEKLYAQADYFTVNISSPNTPGLRDLQAQDSRRRLMTVLADRREQLSTKHGRHLPLALKVSPDMDAEQYQTLGDDLLQCGFQAIIATNTTQSRAGLRDARFANEQGGLSGETLKYPSRDISARLAEAKPETIDLISVGGIDSADEVRARLQSGAKAVQIYSALIYQGPQMIRRIVRELSHAG